MDGMTQYVQDTLQGIVGQGNLWIVALLVIIIVIIGFIFAGLDFRSSLLISSILVVPMSRDDVAWLPAWVGITYFAVIITFGLYLAWNKMQQN